MPRQHQLFCRITSRQIVLNWYSKFKPQPISGQKSGLRHNKISSKKVIIKVCIFTGGFLFLSVVGLIFWYNTQLSPAGSDLGQLKKVVISAGSDSSDIGQELEKQSIIRSALVFDIYTRITSKNSLLQAGTYRLSPAQSMQQIVDHLVRGNVDQFSITFYPGSTLTDTSNKSLLKKQDVTTVLQNAGYSASEIASALNISNIGQLFDGKPSNSNLEGYVYGETYRFNTGATVEDILQTVFDEFYDVIKSEDLVNKFAAHGLNLYEGITLASIVQSESSNPDDQRQIAQVFYSRLAQGMVLGSDVTYQYAAAKAGLKASPSLNSPYNTRINAGLPPGPISNPGLSALKAVADPAPGDYLYFLSDSAGKIYFANTDAEHQSNIVNYCKENCLE